MQRLRARESNHDRVLVTTISSHREHSLAPSLPPSSSQRLRRAWLGNVCTEDDGYGVHRARVQVTSIIRIVRIISIISSSISIMKLTVRSVGLGFIGGNVTVPDSRLGFPALARLSLPASLT